MTRLYKKIFGAKTLTVKQRKAISRFSLFALFGFALLLIVLPADFFDHGQSLCLSVLLFKQECPACGLTRGIMHLIHFDWENAFAYNMASFLVLPVLVLVWLHLIRREFKLLNRLQQQYTSTI